MHLVSLATSCGISQLFNVCAWTTKKLTSAVHLSFSPCIEYFDWLVQTLVQNDKCAMGCGPNYMTKNNRQMSFCIMLVPCISVCLIRVYLSCAAPSRIIRRRASRFRTFKPAYSVWKFSARKTVSIRKPAEHILEITRVISKQMHTYFGSCA